MVRFQEICDQLKKIGHHRRPLLLVKKPTTNNSITSDQVRPCDLSISLLQQILGHLIQRVILQTCHLYHASYSSPQICTHQ